ncbi:hypothetical protein GC176_26840 [bacterium]|nr:hypothetical protein [bacterium]
MNEMILIGAGVACVALIAWMLYMMTFKPKIWTEHVDQAERRKEARHQRRKEMGTIIAGIVRAAMKK